MSAQGWLWRTRLVTAIVAALVVLSPAAQPSAPARASEPSPAATAIEIRERLASNAEVLLIFDSRRTPKFDTNFCRIAEYYGAACRTLALDRTALTDRALRDERGGYFSLIGLSPSLLTGSPRRLSDRDLALLGSALTAGANVLASVAVAEAESPALAALSEGAVRGITAPQGERRQWTAATAAREVTGVFAGQAVSCTSSALAPVRDLSFQLARPERVTALVSVAVQTGPSQPILMRYQRGRGSLFVSGGEAIESIEGENTLRIVYYKPCRFSQIVPLMMVARYALGRSAWHANRLYADFVIDDPPLRDPYNDLSWRALLDDMQAHEYHTTVAFIPAKWRETAAATAGLFRTHLDRFALVQHGNNHDGYEFYQYSVTALELLRQPALLPRPLADQIADIDEGLARLQQHARATGIPFDQVMVFPHGISPEPTLAVLKQRGYLGTLDSETVPLGGSPSTAWDFGMYLVISDYGNLPMLGRLSAMSPRQRELIPFDLFLGKPAILYAHPADFGSDWAGFGPDADWINSMAEVEWRSPGYIFEHLYLERRNADQSIDVLMSSRRLVITPEQSGPAVYHVFKPETADVLRAAVTVNGRRVPYVLDGGWLRLDIRQSRAAPIEIEIDYTPETPGR